MKIKFVADKCEKCGFENKVSGWKFLFKFVGSFIIAMLCLLGIFALGQITVLGTSDTINTFLTAGFMSVGNPDNEMLRNYALDLTTYDGFDSFEFALDLKEHMPRVRYVPTNLFGGMATIEYTLQYGGDCKHVSSLFVALMRSVGYKAYVDCSYEYAHCVAKIPSISNLEYPDHYMIVDLTNDMVRIYKNDVDHWENKEDVEYKRYVVSSEVLNSW